MHPEFCPPPHLLIHISETPLDFQADPTLFDRTRFTPWGAVPPTEKDEDMTLRLALHRHIRSRGGLDQRATRFHLYHYRPEAPVGKAGRPKNLQYTEFNVTKKD